MSKAYVYGDLHFGHENMAKKRGFETIEDHDNHIIKKWNSVVTKRDKVYLLGDITMEKANYTILKKLNGNKVVIGGNHDKPGHVKELLKYVSGVAGAIKYKGFIMTHIPIHKSELHRFRGNIHAHVHEKILKHKRYICVSAEAIDYKPLEIKTITINKNIFNHVFSFISKHITIPIKFRMGWK
jgi:calcineurin-like phosphoesterase family protein